MEKSKRGRQRLMLPWLRSQPLIIPDTVPKSHKGGKWPQAAKGHALSLGGCMQGAPAFRSTCNVNAMGLLGHSEAGTHMVAARQPLAIVKHGIPRADKRIDFTVDPNCKHESFNHRREAPKHSRRARARPTHIGPSQ